MKRNKLVLPALALVASFTAATTVHAGPQANASNSNDIDIININKNKANAKAVNKSKRHRPKAERPKVKPKYNKPKHVNKNNVNNRSNVNSKIGVDTVSKSNSNASAKTGPISVNNKSNTSLSTGDIAQKNTQTVGDTSQVVGDTSQTIGDTSQVVGDTSQTTNAQTTGNVTNVEGQSVSYNNETLVGAITGAPSLGSQTVLGECKEGWGFSIGGGSPFSGSGGIGIQKTAKDDDCIREGREHEKTLTKMSIEHKERVTEAIIKGNEKVARIKSATEIAKMGMKHLCNLAAQKSIPVTQANRPEHGACENNTETAMEFLFPGANNRIKPHSHKH